MGAAFLFLLLVGAPACQLPPPLPQEPADYGTGRARDATAEIPSGELLVRLADQEERLELEVGGVGEGELRFSAEGETIRCSNGERRASFRVVPQRPRGALTLDGRSYYGALWIRLHENQGLRVENQVGLEHYIAGVVPSELVLWSAEEPEIEAQAIAARTYALQSLMHRQKTGSAAFLWDDTRDQVYLGNYRGESSPAAQRVEARYRRALASSRGRVVLNSAGQLYDVRFHASCGGNTCSPAEAFPSESGLHHAAVACEPCRMIGAKERALPATDSTRRRVHWNWTADGPALSQLAHAIGVGQHVLALRDVKVDRHARWQSVVVEGDQGHLRISVERLRRELGPARLKGSAILRTWPALGDPIESGLFFEGVGRGHGAGLCQVGSHEYARQGWSARQILQHYLPGARIAAVPSE